MLHRLIRVEPAFDDPARIRALFERHAPYKTIATYGPAGMVDDPAALVDPYFRGNWAVGGRVLAEGAGEILHHERFLAAARDLFQTQHVVPTTVVVNLSAAMPAGPPHIDNPPFLGATRETYPLPLLRVMNFSKLFARWQIDQAGALVWFYDGEGGTFDCWPNGLDQPAHSESTPYNVALVSDNDRMYHRIGRVGAENVPELKVPFTAEMSGSKRGWAIHHDGELCADVPREGVRLSILWKAEIREQSDEREPLTPQRVAATFAADLERRAVPFRMPADPLRDTAWLTLLQEAYPDPVGGDAKSFRR